MSILFLYHEIILVVLHLQVFCPAELRQHIKVCNGLDSYNSILNAYYIMLLQQTLWQGRI